MEKNTIVQLKGSKIQMLLPQGFERLKMKNPIKDALNRITSDFVGYRKTVEYSDNIVLFKKISEEEAMNPDDRTELINGIHECLSDTQGIVEVKNGITVNGEKYIYSIVKTLKGKGMGVQYNLTMHISFGTYAMNAGIGTAIDDNAASDARAESNENTGFAAFRLSIRNVAVSVSPICSLPDITLCVSVNVPLHEGVQST